MNAKYAWVAMLAMLVLLVSGCDAPQLVAGGTRTPHEIGKALVGTVLVVTLESFPVQVHVTVRGTLSDGCTELSDVVQTREGNVFRVDVFTKRPLDAMCTQAVQMFEETVALDVLGLDAGTYTVEVNGVQETFTLTVDNVAQQ